MCMQLHDSYTIATKNALYTCVGHIIPFHNPIGLLVFAEESFKSIKLIPLNDILKVSHD